MPTLAKGKSKNKSTADQSRIAYIYSTLAFLSLVVFGTLHIVVENNPHLGILEIAGGLVAASTTLVLRITRNAWLAHNLLLLCMLSMLVVMLFTGGTANSGIFWFFMFPVSAFFLAGKKGGALWMALAFTMTLTVMVLQELTLVATPYSFITLRQLLVSLLVITIGIYVYQQSRETMAHETEESQEISAEEKLKADIIMKNIDEGVVALDTAGHIILANRSAENILGWKTGELVGQRFVDAVPMFDAVGNEVDVAHRPMQLTLSQGKASQSMAIYGRKDGGKVPAFITSKALVIDGKVKGAIGTFRDITQESAINRAKSDFVTLASHQLRTPISAIAWVSELLLHGDAGKLKPDQADYIQQIYHSNKRMAALVDAMLTASSLELGGLPVRPEPVDLPKMCREVLEKRLDMLTADKILHIKEDYDPNLPKAIMDRTIVKTILQNLITNAFKYTPSNGSVSVSIRKSDQQVSDTAQKATILIQVADTGFGIPKNQQSKIYTKLFRAENIKHQDTDGTGLGLYIVKTATQYVGGRMWFVSEENKGSSFSVLLPAVMHPQLGSGPDPKEGM